MKSECLVLRVLEKFMSLSTYIINWGLILIISAILLVISCAKSDDLEIIDNETPVENGSLIMYTDIEPDFVSSNEIASYEFDFNKDQIVDFTLESIYYPEGDYEGTWFPSSYDLFITSKSNDASGIISVTPWYANPVPLDSGKEIFYLSGYTNGETYENWGTFIIGNCGNVVDWKCKNDKYLGLRFPKDGKMYFGWVRLEVTSATQWVIKDYAYNATPNKPILAGEK